MARGPKIIFCIFEYLCYICLVLWVLVYIDFVVKPEDNPCLVSPTNLSHHATPGLNMTTMEKTRLEKIKYASQICIFFGIFDEEQPNTREYVRNGDFYMSTTFVHLILTSFVVAYFDKIASFGKSRDWSDWKWLFCYLFINFCLSIFHSLLTVVFNIGRFNSESGKHTLILHSAALFFIVAIILQILYIHKFQVVIRKKLPEDREMALPEPR